MSSTWSKPPLPDRHLERQIAALLADSGSSVELVDDRLARFRLILGVPVVTGIDRDRVAYVSHLGFELRFEAQGERQLSLDARPWPGSPAAFHPYVEPASGRWLFEAGSSDSWDPMSWIVGLIDSLLYRFSPAPLSGPIANPVAAEWYEQARRRDGLLPTGENPLLRAPRDSPRGLPSPRFRPRSTTLVAPPVERPIPEPLTYETGVHATINGSRHRLIVLGDAARELFDHIGWGRRTIENGVEQGGILVGEVYSDPERELVYAVVERAVPARRAYGSTTYVYMGPEDWKEMLTQADLTSVAEARRRVLGWYHTHPNELRVFMSGTDEATQQRLFPRDWHFALVLNPHRQAVKAFHGFDARECSFTIDPERSLDRNGREAPQAAWPVDVRVSLGSVQEEAPTAPQGSSERPHPPPRRGLFARIQQGLRHFSGRRDLDCAPSSREATAWDNGGASDLDDPTRGRGTADLD